MADRLNEAIRRKFRTPADAVRALGLDPKLLDKGNDMTVHDSRYGRSGVTGARDEGEGLTDKERDDYLDLIAQHRGTIARDRTARIFARDAERLGASAETREGERGSPSAMDTPADLPSGGRPTPGGNPTPLIQARDGSMLHNRGIAMDAAGERLVASIMRRAPGPGDYYKRFPVPRNGA